VSESKEKKYDVIVVGGGNAALCAAIAARRDGARVLVLERAPEAERGGNSTFTDGVVRFAYDSAQDIIDLSGDLTEEEIATSDFGVYPADKFFDDIVRVTENRTDPDLCEIVVRQSKAAMFWMKERIMDARPIVSMGVSSFQAAVRWLCEVVARDLWKRCTPPRQSWGSKSSTTRGFRTCSWKILV